jgi:hypothetical protein
MPLYARRVSVSPVDTGLEGDRLPRLCRGGGGERSICICMLYACVSCHVYVCMIVCVSCQLWTCMSVFVSMYVCVRACLVNCRHAHDIYSYHFKAFTLLQLHCHATTPLRACQPYLDDWFGFPSSSLNPPPSFLLLLLIGGSRLLRVARSRSAPPLSLLLL